MRTDDKNLQLFAMTQNSADPVDPEAVTDYLDLSNKRARFQAKGSERPATTPNQRRLSSKLLISSLKKSTFLRGLSRRRNRSGSLASAVSSDTPTPTIPPLSVRICTTEETSDAPRPKRRRKTNELYSPWLQKSRFNFLKKYRLGNDSKRGRASLPGRTTSDDFSPGWSRVKGIRAEFGQHPKGQLDIKSTRRRTVHCRGFRRSTSVPSGPQSVPGVVCHFLMPLGHIGGRDSKNPLSDVMCSECGQTVLVSAKMGTPKKPALKSPAPCPLVHDIEAYWPESGRKLPPPLPLPPRSSTFLLKKLEFSPAPTSVVTIQPSYIPQSFSLNTMQLEWEGNNESAAGTKSEIKVSSRMMTYFFSVVSDRL